MNHSIHTAGSALAVCKIGCGALHSDNPQFLYLRISIASQPFHQIAVLEQIATDGTAQKTAVSGHKY